MQEFEMKRFLAFATLALFSAGCQDVPEPTGPAAPSFAPAFSVAIDPALTELLSAASTDTVEVIVSYHEEETTAGALIDAILDTGAGVIGFQNLAMAAALATPEQIAVIQTVPGVRSIYLNSAERLLNAEGVGSVRADQVHAMGITGKGVGVAILDTGIDGTHPDLLFPSKTVQNAKVIANSKDVYHFKKKDSLTGDQPPKPLKKGFELYEEDIENTDLNNGHGTHVAASAAGTGAASDGKYRGVAPGAHLIGVNAATAGGVFTSLEILAGFDYIIENRDRYNIQVVNNSWGSEGSFDPESPINIATKEVHDAGITVVFAAGNSGPGQNTMNPRSVAPWVISVAAGCKFGEDPTNSVTHCVAPAGAGSDWDPANNILAYFSSRGVPGDPLYHPDITAPGVHIVSARSSTGFDMSVFAANHDATICAIDLAHVDSYTCASGTSMASPHLAGIVALMEEASGGTLTPDEALRVLTATARPLSGYAEWEVGAGYADALAAVQAVKK
jgi:serine protease AprX